MVRNVESCLTSIRSDDSTYRFLSRFDSPMSGLVFLVAYGLGSRQLRKSNSPSDSISQSTLLTLIILTVRPDDWEVTFRRWELHGNSKKLADENYHDRIQRAMITLVHVRIRRQ